MVDHEQIANLGISLAAGAFGGFFGVGLRKGKRKYSESFALVGNGAIIGSLIASGVEWWQPGHPTSYLFVSASVSLVVCRHGEESLLWLLDIFLERLRRGLDLYSATGRALSKSRRDDPASADDDASDPPDVPPSSP